MLLCVLVGSGVQVLIMSMFTIAFAAVGFVSPANRGSLMVVMLFLFVLMGSFAGYNTARLVLVRGITVLVRGITVLVRGKSAGSG